MTKDELISAVYAELDDTAVQLSVYERTLIRVTARVAFEDSARMGEELFGNYLSINPGAYINGLRAKATEFA